MTGDDEATIGALVRQARRAANLSQEELAARAGLSARGISDLERGVIRMPHQDTLELLISALDLSDEDRRAWEHARRQVVQQARAAQRRARGTAGNLRPTLPTRLTSFIGRERDLTALAELLGQPSVRLVTVTGPGGVGKTSLVVQVAQQVHDAFPDGVVFVALQMLSDPQLVAGTIAQALGLQESGDQPLVDRVVTALQDRELLLILDNFEQLLPAAPLLTELLGHCPLLFILVTSRVALRLSGEHIVSALPLALPDLGPATPLDELAQVESVRLFIERARQASSDFQLTEANAAAVTAICARLDGLPLAIELAAPRIRVLSPLALQARLEHRLQVLTSGPRDVPARQQTMRATIAWSYELLDEGVQRLFRQLAVFVGGWTLAAAEAVCDPDLDVFGGHATLVESSLIQQVEQPDGTPRYRLLETLREYGIEQLAECGEEERIRQRHAAYFVELGETLAPGFDGPDQIGILEHLEREHPNIRAALDWFVTRGDAAAGLQLAGAVGLFWHLRGHLSEGRQQYQRLFALPQAGVSAKVRARALTLAGALAQWQQDYERAVALEHEALSLWATVPLSEQHLAWGAFSILGDAARARGDAAEARAWYEQLLAHAQRVGGTRNVAAGFMQLGNLRIERGEYEQAAELLGQALSLARPARDSWIISICLANLAFISLRLGSLTRARELLDESVELARGMGNRTQLAEYIVMQGWLDLAEGRLEAAEVRFEEGRALGREVGARGTVADALVWLGDVALRRSDLDDAEQQYREALVLARAIGASSTTISVIEGVARISLARGDVERAVRLLGATSREREAPGLPWLPMFEDAAIERALATAQQALPATRFSNAWATGQSMSLDEATVEADEALSVSATAAGPAPTAGVTQLERHIEHTTPRAPGDGPPLTPRERDVLRLLVEGLSDTEIAERLSIGPRTVSGHVANILNKLGLPSRAAVATYAVRHKLA